MDRKRMQRLPRSRKQSVADKMRLWLLSVRENWILYLGIIVLLGALAAMAPYVSFDPSIGKNKQATGFGPEWDCASPPLGEPVCIKRAKPTD